MKAYIRAQNGPWYTDVNLFIGSKDGSIRVKEIVFEKLDEFDVKTHPPSFHLENFEAQILMDDLWQCGIRPTEGSGSAGAMRAAENHLKDLRAVTFSLLKIPKP